MVIELRATALPGTTCGAYRFVEVGVQVGRDTVDVVPADAPSATWVLEVTRTADGDWKGKAVHGKRGERFLYLVWRSRAGPEAEPVMFRRAKLWLDAVPPEVGDRVVGELGLTDGHGMPLCASVRPPTIRWSVGRSVRQRGSGSGPAGSEDVAMIAPKEPKSPGS